MLVVEGPGCFSVPRYTQILKVDSTNKRKPLSLLTDDRIALHDNVYLVTADGKGGYVPPDSKTPCFWLEKFQLIDGEIPDPRSPDTGPKILGRRRHSETDHLEEEPCGCLSDDCWAFVAKRELQPCPQCSVPSLSRHCAALLRKCDDCQNPVPIRPLAPPLVFPGWEDLLPTPASSPPSNSASTRSLTLATAVAQAPTQVPPSSLALTTAPAVAQTSAVAPAAAHAQAQAQAHAPQSKRRPSPSAGCVDIDSPPKRRR